MTTIQKTIVINLNTIINMRGAREQCFKFAFGKKGGMKQCFTRGADIFTPLFHNIKDTEISNEMRYESLLNGEIDITNKVYFKLSK